MVSRVLSGRCQVPGQRLAVSTRVCQHELVHDLRIQRTDQRMRSAWHRPGGLEGPWWRFVKIHDEDSSCFMVIPRIYLDEYEDWWWWWRCILMLIMMIKTEDDHMVGHFEYFECLPKAGLVRLSLFSLGRSEPQGFSPRRSGMPCPSKTALSSTQWQADPGIILGARWCKAIKCVI